MTYAVIGGCTCYKILNSKIYSKSCIVIGTYLKTEVPKYFGSQPWFEFPGFFPVYYLKVINVNNN